jgi:hypothetical protein
LGPKVSEDEKLLVLGPGLLIAVVLTTELLSIWRGATRERAWINGMGALLVTLAAAITSIFAAGSDMISVGVGLGAPLVGLTFSLIATAQGVRWARWGAGLFLLSALALVWYCCVTLNGARIDLG